MCFSTAACATMSSSATRRQCDFTKLMMAGYELDMSDGTVLGVLRKTLSKKNYRVVVDGKVDPMARTADVMEIIGEHGQGKGLRLCFLSQVQPRIFTSLFTARRTPSTREVCIGCTLHCPINIRMRRRELVSKAEQCSTRTSMRKAAACAWMLSTRRGHRCISW